jgi:hypothetical protein
VHVGGAMFESLPGAGEEMPPAIADHGECRDSHSRPNIPEAVAFAREPIATDGKDPRVAHYHREGSDRRAKPPFSHQSEVFTLKHFSLTVSGYLARRRFVTHY